MPHDLRTAGTARTRPRRARVATLLLALAVLAAGCGSDDDTSSSAAPSSTTTAAAGAPSTAAPLEGEITVAAAASLTKVFGELGEQFEADHPGTTVTFTFDSSGTLATQITEGAPVDVFASADTTNMQKVVDADLVDGSPTTFARNQLVIVTQPGNPLGIGGLADLSKAAVVSLCADTAPCGRYADQVLTGAGVTLATDRVTRGQNATATLSAVADGDADAGIVYVSDATGNEAVEAVEIPEAQNAVATYPIAVLSATADRDVAEAFVELVTGAAGTEALTGAGFLTP